LCSCVFFFQAEGGIRDYKVTGVQTCALPISEAAEALLDLATGATPQIAPPVASGANPFQHPDAQRRFRVMNNLEELARALDYPRSEERRVGKECRSRGRRWHHKKKNATTSHR